MRVAIISDIHGNKPALDAVFQDSTDQRVDEYWCLGDVIGYGPWPFQCWLFLEKTIKPTVWLPGNHELGLLKPNSSYCQGDAKTVIDIHSTVLRKVYPSILQTIEQLSKKHVAEPSKGIFLAHGLYDSGNVFNSITSYVDNIITKQYLAEKAFSQLSEAQQDPHILVVGHTHRSIFSRRTYDLIRKRPAWTRENSEGSISFSKHEAVLINPGSVGQPRDGNFNASYCILELDGDFGSVEFRRISYPLELTRQTMEKLGYPATLIKQWYLPSATGSTGETK